MTKMPKLRPPGSDGWSIIPDLRAVLSEARVDHDAFMSWFAPRLENFHAGNHWEAEFNDYRRDEEWLDGTAKAIAAMQSALHPRLLSVRMEQLIFRARVKPGAWMDLHKRLRDDLMGASLVVAGARLEFEKVQKPSAGAPSKARLHGFCGEVANKLYDLMSAKGRRRKRAAMFASDVMKACGLGTISPEAQKKGKGKK